MTDFNYCCVLFTMQHALLSFPRNKANARIVKFDSCGNCWLRVFNCVFVRRAQSAICLLLMLSLEVFQINSSCLIRAARRERRTMGLSHRIIREQSSLCLIAHYYTANYWKKHMVYVAIICGVYSLWCAYVMLNNVLNSWES
jgi:hypothetical protein